MRKIILYCLALISFSSVVAQSPEAIREIIRENSNFSIPTVTTYDNISIGKIASAPRGYKPFYY